MDLSNRVIEKVHVSDIKWGDTVKCLDGFVRTVGKNDIKHGCFCGSSLFGNSYNGGRILVERVKI